VNPKFFRRTKEKVFLPVVMEAVVMGERGSGKVSCGVSCRVACREAGKEADIGADREAGRRVGREVGRGVDRGAGREPVVGQQESDTVRVGTDRGVEL